MSDNPQAAGSQAEPQATPQAGTQPAQAPAAATPPKSPEQVSDLPKWAQDLIGGLRDEAAGKRKARQQQESAEQTEAQTLRASLDELTPRYADLETKYNTLRAQIALRNAGADEEAADLLAAKLDASVLDDPDKLTKAIDKLRQERPRLFRVASLDGGARGSASADVQPGLARIANAYATNDTRRR